MLRLRVAWRLRLESVRDAYPAFGARATTCSRPAYGAPSAGILVARCGALFGLKVGRAGQCGIERFPYDG